MDPLIMHISAKWNIKPWGCSSPGKTFRRAHKNAAFKHLPVKSIPLFSVSHLLSHPQTHTATHTCTLRTLSRDTNLFDGTSAAVKTMSPFICNTTVHVCGPLTHSNGVLCYLLYAGYLCCTLGKPFIYFILRVRLYSWFSGQISCIAWPLIFELQLKSL